MDISVDIIFVVQRDFRRSQLPPLPTQLSLTYLFSEAEEWVLVTVFLFLTLLDSDVFSPLVVRLSQRRFKSCVHIQTHINRE